MSDIIWTAREALACAYCWSEFHLPQPNETPESYWLKISEKARNECRSYANKLMLLPVARREMVAMPPHTEFYEDQRSMLMDRLRYKQEGRMRDVYVGIFRALKERLDRNLKP